MSAILDNNIVQGTGYVADAYARIVVDKDFKKAYDLVLKAVAAFGARNVVKQIVRDMDELHARGQLPTSEAGD